MGALSSRPIQGGPRVAALLCVVGAATSSYASEPPPSVGRELTSAPAPRKTWLARGVELRKAGDDHGARAAFAEAWKATRSPEALAQLALAEQAIGLWVDAREHLEGALEHGDHPWIRRHRATLDIARAEIGSRLGRLEVSCNVPGAELSMDGRLIGKTPLAAPLYWLAGRSVIQVSAEGYFDVTRQVQIDAGALARLQVTLTPKTQTAVTTALRAPLDAANPTQADAASGSARSAGNRVDGVTAKALLEYGSIGVSALGLAVGVTGYVMREVNVRSYNDDTRCNLELGRRRSQECSDEAAAWRLGETLAIAGFSAAIVFGGLGLYLWLDEPDGSLSSAQCEVGFEGIHCLGHF
jgi:hypothetical protein